MNIDEEEQHRRLIILYIVHRRRRNRRKRNNRRYWVRPINCQRNEQGDGANLIVEMRLTDTEAHFDYCRLTVESFNELLLLVGPRIEKQDTNFRESISARIRLYMTLRFLASGDSMSSIAFAYRVGRSTVSQIVAETCDVIWETLQKELFEPSEENWREVANDFNARWNFPHCIGGIDGKHIVIKAPPHAGSTFYNYKGQHSIILMAIVSASYRFLLVDIGAQGRHSDGGVFSNSIMGQLFLRDEMSLPPPSAIAFNQPILPYMLVADEAFQLNKFMLRPYPGRNINNDQRIFNYRLSRARRVSENAFGIMVARFRIFQGPIFTSLSTAEKIVKAAVVLHNFLMPRNRYCNNEFADRIVNGEVATGHWRKNIRQNEGMRPIGPVGSNSHSRYAANIRDTYKNYFLNAGAVPWQWNLDNY